MGKVHWLALSMISGIGGSTARKLVERFGCVEGVFRASEQELLAVPRITPQIAEGIRAASLEDVESGLENLEDQGICVLTLDDDDYPANLREASDAPILLFVHGDLLPSDAQAVAIIGTREPSAESEAFAEGLSRELASRGLTIISGLALGIDCAAHRGALLADGGRTIAVLGSGLRCIHPRSNVPLAEEIAGRGALISELWPDTPVSGPLLMARDRIISGLSRAVIVVEAGLKSGSLDTASKAHRQGRLVFAVPGSPGTDDLLRSDAEPLDPETLDLDALAERINSFSGQSDAQLGLL